MTTPALVPASAVRVLLDVAYERARQLDRGFDAEHDDRQPLGHWGWLLARRANDVSAPDLAAVSKDEPRRLLLEIATIAVAAAESLDRRSLESCEDCGEHPFDCTCDPPSRAEQAAMDRALATAEFLSQPIIAGRAPHDTPHAYIPSDDRLFAPCSICQRAPSAPDHLPRGDPR